MKKFLSVALICLALTACQDTRFVFSEPIPAKPSYTVTQHYLFMGRKATIEPVKVCGSMSNVAMVEEVETTSQSWIRGLTGCIYNPVTVNVYCKQPVKNSYKAGQPK